MSRVYFHSPSDTVELAGSERAWLNHLASGPGKAAWDLDRSQAFDRAVEIMALVPERTGDDVRGGYLHEYLREAVAENEANKEVYARPDWRDHLHRTSHAKQNRFVNALATALQVNGLDMVVADIPLHSGNLEMNTALVAGSDPIKLAAKIHGWCEVFAWVDGPDRAWMAGVMQQGLDIGLYRRGRWYTPMSFEKTTEPRWISQGWEDVIAFLRQRDDEPVVMSYSVCEQFPDADIADWLPAWPQGVERNWDALTAEQQQEHEERQESWYDLSHEEQWQRGMAGLKRRRPWAQITPDNLASTTFGPAVTVYDLFSSDRDERVRTAAGQDLETAR